MEKYFGIEHGSYIWGHLKWKDFFHDLECNHGLDPQCPGHIWLLHYRFLEAINEDAQEWVEAQNSHKISICGIERFLEPVAEDLAVDDIIGYGLMTHLLENNPEDWDNDNAFVPATTPSNLNKFEALTQKLHFWHDVMLHNMNTHRLLWADALATCYRMYDGF
ncbi:hypothetical protein BDN71DRAFT_1482160 [Pleurotus eryngii]|uniref:Integrase core domain-containing protein n=1 Tax=Pleurotus eryngii TaxID=5323 RepID=A0A9P5ZYZ4_PLEER|nr:hypothetical protein BDN71DRAFT_1482160 [Pleurotus eryngii]